MSHDATKALMGSTQSNIKESTNYPSALEAGVVGHLATSGSVTATKSDGGLVGVSLGDDLSGGIGRKSFCRKGLRVPLKLTAAFDPVIGAVVNVSDTTGLGIASGGGATALNAVYATGRLGGTGVNGGLAENGAANVGVALIDFPGGL